MLSQNNFTFDSGSFRDPSGVVFYQNHVLYRQINRVYKQHYEVLMNSGLYEKLTANSWLVSHQEAGLAHAISLDIYKIIKPEPVAFVSYPYAWSFSQLKDAALLMLTIQETALQYGMSLKDASAFNIQFHNGKPILIDTLSFEVYQKGKPWVAYKQFCQHFLAPLALMALVDVRLSSLLRPFIDGVPLDLASHLLPWKTYLNPGLTLHIHLHARTQKKYADNAEAIKNTSMTMNLPALFGFLDNLKTTINRLHWKCSATETEWGDYYTFTNYSDKAFAHKRRLVQGWVKMVNPRMVWDLGANTGEFSRIASERGINTIAFDIDPIAVEKNYMMTKSKQETHLLPLFLDLTNPSPALGWAHSERKSLLERGPVDMVFALALIHHLVITNNIPLSRVADFLAKISTYLILEFVPKSDSQVQKLLTSREDVFSHYSLKQCLIEFSPYFTLVEKVKLEDSHRVLLLFKRN
jgi:hypothetical protein